MVYYCLSQTEEVCKCIGHASQQIETSQNLLLGVVAYENLTTKQKFCSVSNSENWLQQLIGVVAYERF